MSALCILFHRLRWRSTEVICSHGGDVSERWRSRIKFGVCGDRARSAINVVPHRKAGAVLGGLLGPGLPLAPYGACACASSQCGRCPLAQAAASHRRGSKRFRIRSLGFLIHDFWAGRKSSIFGVWAAPGAPKLRPAGGPISVFPR